MRVVVVGAGVVGLAVSRVLLRRGCEVICLEAAVPMAARSAGSSRLLRTTDTCSEPIWSRAGRDRSGPSGTPSSGHSSPGDGTRPAPNAATNFPASSASTGTDSSSRRRTAKTRPPSRDTSAGRQGRPVDVPASSTPPRPAGICAVPSGRACVLNGWTASSRRPTGSRCGPTPGGTTPTTS
ncbi:FAD-dependent oxidoreductase [Actinophytocola sp.]|uniref:FAD-dependent oxidoreductase n=1 Tax=Actinophytocola sp. TaxID=1872138 RepID=UPI0039C8A6AD